MTPAEIIDALYKLGIALGGFAAATLVLIKAVKPLVKLTPTTIDDEARDYAEKMLEAALKHVKGQK